MAKEDGNGAGESHSEDYDLHRAMPLKVNILELLKLSRWSGHRGECPISGLHSAARPPSDLISGK